MLKFLGMKCTINAIYLGNDSVARLIQITADGMAIENDNNSWRHDNNEMQEQQTAWQY